MEVPTIKHFFTLTLILFSALFLAACQNRFDPDLYSFAGVPQTKTISVSDAQKQLTEASAYLRTLKSYSYFQTIHGASEAIYDYSGTTQIDTTDGIKMATALTGDLDYAFYILDNRIYINMNGTKTVQDLGPDHSGIASLFPEGEFMAFDIADLKAEAIITAGKDKYGALIIQCQGPNDLVTIVLDKGRIRKVFYAEDEILYSAVYDYNPIAIVFPDDLDTYQEK